MSAKAIGHNPPVLAARRFLHKAALAPRAARPNDALHTLFSIIQAAGWPIWPLIACSIVALALIIERLLSLRSKRIIPPSLLDEALTVTRQGLPSTDVVNKLHDNSILGQVLAAGMRAAISDPKIAEPALRQAFETAGRSAALRTARSIPTTRTTTSR